MRTIAVFHPSAELYGADRILVNALGALPKEVIKKVYLLREGPLEEFLKDNVDNVDVVIRTDMPVIYRAIFTPKGILQTLVNFIGFLFFVRKENGKFDFQSAYVNTSSNVLLLPILKLCGIRNYIHIHEIIDSPKFIGWFSAFMARWFSDKVVCVSKAVQLGMMRYVKSIEKVAVVIHNGIDAIEVDRQVSDDVISNNSKLNFYLFGRIQVRKGHWFLIEALAKIPKRLLASTKFTLMGGIVPGCEQDLVDLQKTIDKYGLTQFVDIKDFAADISEPMSKADVCLVPSLVKDSFPTTVIEAMSAGRPVITTNNGGAKEAVLEARTGFLIDPDNTDQLADRIMRLILNKEKVQSMGAEAEKQYRTHFTKEHFVTSWMKFIENESMLFIKTDPILKASSSRPLQINVAIDQ